MSTAARQAASSWCAKLFDDTGLGDLLESDEAGQALGVEAARELTKLSRLIDGLPRGLEAAALMHHPAWVDIVGTAERAADLLDREPQ